jgi:hypothetical protein
MMVEEDLLFLFPESGGFFKCAGFVFCGDQPELFIELRILVSVSAAVNAVNDLCEIPVHKNGFKGR